MQGCSVDAVPPRRSHVLQHDKEAAVVVAADAQVVVQVGGEHEQHVRLAGGQCHLGRRRHAHELRCGAEAALKGCEHKAPAGKGGCAQGRTGELGEGQTMSGVMCAGKGASTTHLQRGGGQGGR
eukprot:365017-Chlamydomonas_euryale.AAC.4